MSLDCLIGKRMKEVFAGLQRKRTFTTHKRMTLQFQLVSSEADYWEQVEGLKGSSDYFDEQGDAHGFIDGELQDAIENILVPIVGPWEGSDVWFHNQDFYGNGIRSLIFRAGYFPWSSVEDLQKLLIGDAARFCITVQIFETLQVNAQLVGSMAILQTEIIATQYVSEMLKTNVGIAAK